MNIRKRAHNCLWHNALWNYKILSAVYNSCLYTSQTRCLEKRERPSAIYAFVNRYFTWKLYSKLTRNEREKNKLRVLLYMHLIFFCQLTLSSREKTEKRPRSRTINLNIFVNLLAIPEKPSALNEILRLLVVEITTRVL